MENLHNIEGLYAITPEENNLSLLKAQVESAIKGGAKFVQYRSKILSKKPFGGGNGGGGNGNSKLERKQFG